jgi:hypothetical protein
MHVPKVISDNAILGQLGVNFVEKILLNMGFVLHTTNSLEAGIEASSNSAIVQLAPHLIFL